MANPSAIARSSFTADQANHCGSAVRMSSNTLASTSTISILAARNFHYLVSGDLHRGATSCLLHPFTETRLFRPGRPNHDATVALGKFHLRLRMQPVTLPH